MSKLLILMDINMLEVNGIEASRMIRDFVGSVYREHVVKEHLRIVAVSAQEECYIADMTVFDKFLKKPIEAKELTELLNNFGF